MTRRVAGSAIALALSLSPACVIHVRGTQVQFDPDGHETVSTPDAPLPLGAYSQAVRVEERVWTAAQIGIDPATGQLVAGGVAAETRQALVNLRSVLEASGFSLRDTVQAQVFLADLGDERAMDEAYAGFFPPPSPARTTVGVSALPRGARVQIQLVAERRD